MQTQQNTFIATLRNIDVALGGNLHLVVAIVIFAFGIPALGEWLGYGAVAIIGVLVLIFGRQVMGWEED